MSMYLENRDKQTFHPWRRMEADSVNNWKRVLWPAEEKSKYYKKQAAKQHRCDLENSCKKAQQSSLSVPFMFAGKHFGKGD